MRFCAQCGTENRDTTKFCKSCGHQAQEPGHDPEPLASFFETSCKEPSFIMPAHQSWKNLNDFMNIVLLLTFILVAFVYFTMNPLVALLSAFLLLPIVTILRTTMTRALKMKTLALLLSPDSHHLKEKKENGS